VPFTPESFDAARGRLLNELVLLHDAWDQYMILGASPQNAAVLNKCASWFFGLVQRTVLREVLLGLSRVTDPMGKGKRLNLVLDTLLHDPALESRPDVHSAITEAIATAKKTVAPMRIHRHKYIAHLDHAVALGDTSELVKGVTTEGITAAIRAVEEPYRIHSLRVRGIDPSFEVASLGDATALLKVLENSDRWRRHLELNKPQ
jgi:hypothetical protein